MPLFTNGQMKDFAVRVIFGPVETSCMVFAANYTAWLPLFLKFKDLFPISRFHEAKHRLLQRMLVFPSPFTKVEGDEEPGYLK